MSHEHDRVLILDFGSQFTKLIARRIREERVYCEIQPPTLPLERIRAFAPAGIVLSGGPASVLDAGSPDADPALLELGVPVLGICYGEQWLVQRLGGVVEKAEARAAATDVEAAGRTPRALEAALVEKASTTLRNPQIVVTVAKFSEKTIYVGGEVAKLGEGVVNGMMTARIGVAAMEVTRPLPFSALKRPGMADFLAALASFTRGKAGAADA